MIIMVTNFTVITFTTIVIVVIVVVIVVISLLLVSIRTRSQSREALNLVVPRSAFLDIENSVGAWYHTLDSSAFAV